MRDAREVRGHLDNSWLQFVRLLQQFCNVVVLPPRLNNGMIRDKPAIGGDEESRSKSVHAHFGTDAAELHLRPAIGISGRAVGSHGGIAKNQAGTLVAETEHNMQQANARRVRANDVLRHRSLGLKRLQSVMGGSKLTLKFCHLRWISSGYLVAQLFVLALQILTLRFRRVRAFCSTCTRALRASSTSSRSLAIPVCNFASAL